MFQQLSALAQNGDMLVVYNILAKKQMEYTIEDANELGKTLAQFAEESPILRLETAISLLRFWGFGSSEQYNHEHMQMIYTAAFTNYGYVDTLDSITKILSGINILYTPANNNSSFEIIHDLYNTIRDAIEGANDKYLAWGAQRLFLNEVLNFPFTDNSKEFLQELAADLNKASDIETARAAEIAQAMLARN